MGRRCSLFPYLLTSLGFFLHFVCVSSDLEGDWKCAVADVYRDRYGIFKPGTGSAVYFRFRSDTSVRGGRCSDCQCYHTGNLRCCGYLDTLQGREGDQDQLERDAAQLGLDQKAVQARPACQYGTIRKSRCDDDDGHYCSELRE